MESIGEGVLSCAASAASMWARVADPANTCACARLCVPQASLVLPWATTSFRCTSPSAATARCGTYACLAGDNRHTTHTCCPPFVDIAPRRHTATPARPTCAPRSVRPRARASCQTEPRASPHAARCVEPGEGGGTVAARGTPPADTHVLGATRAGCVDCGDCTEHLPLHGHQHLQPVHRGAGDLRCRHPQARAARQGGCAEAFAPVSALP